MAGWTLATFDADEASAKCCRVLGAYQEHADEHNDATRIQLVQVMTKEVGYGDSFLRYYFGLGQAPNIPLYVPDLDSEWKDLFKPEGELPKSNELWQ